MKHRTLFGFEMPMTSATRLPMQLERGMKRGRKTYHVSDDCGRFWGGFKLK